MARLFSGWLTSKFPKGNVPNSIASLFVGSTSTFRRLDLWEATLSQGTSLAPRLDELAKPVTPRRQHCTQILVVIYPMLLRFPPVLSLRICDLLSTSFCVFKMPSWKGVCLKLFSGGISMILKFNVLTHDMYLGDSRACPSRKRTR